MVEIYISTSGRSYPKGKVLRKGISSPSGKINELEYYSLFFNTIEVNSSFYRPPCPEFAENWVKRTTKSFLFAVKLWQQFTHPKMYQEAPGGHAIISQNDVDLFMNSITSLPG